MQGYTLWCALRAGCGALTLGQCLELALRIPPGAQLFFVMSIEEHVPLAPLTTFRLGGVARFFVRVRSVEELQEALAYAKEKNMPVLLLGGGSNMLLVGDVNALVIKLEFTGIEQLDDVVVAAAGESWDAFVAWSVSRGLWGLENLSGIPGSVGAAPVQNIGAYGVEIKDTLAWVEAYDTEMGTVVRFSNAECEFGYRTSRFKQESGRFVILRTAFALAPHGTPRVSYRDLLGSEGLSLAELRAKVLAVRASKFPDLSIEGTAGSFFLNPVLPHAQAEALIARYPQLPQFPAEGGVKVSLAWLLDNALGIKGMSEGGARLFEKQPLVVVAERGASSDDVRKLTEKVSALVKNKLGIDLEVEVRIIN